jgi:hypothetical protein
MFRLAAHDEATTRNVEGCRHFRGPSAARFPGSSPRSRRDVSGRRRRLRRAPAHASRGSLGNPARRHVTSCLLADAGSGLPEKRPERSHPAARRPQREEGEAIGDGGRARAHGPVPGASAWTRAPQRRRSSRLPESAATATEALVRDVEPLVVVCADNRSYGRPRARARGHSGATDASARRAGTGTHPRGGAAGTTFQRTLVAPRNR